MAVIAQSAPDAPQGSSLPRLPQAAEAADNLRGLADEILLFTGGDGAAIALARNGELRCRAASGIAPPLGAQIDARSGLTGACITTGTLLRCDDSELDLRVDRQVCRSLAIRSIICVPVRAGQEVVGIFEVFSSRPNAFLKVDSGRLHAKAEEIATCFAAEEALAQAAIATAADLGAAGDLPAAWAPVSPRLPRPAPLPVSNRRWQAILGTLVLALGLFLLFRAIRTSPPASSAFAPPQPASAAASSTQPEPAPDLPQTSREHLRRQESHSARVVPGKDSGKAQAAQIALPGAASAAVDQALAPPPAALVSAGASGPDPLRQLVSSLPSEQPALPREFRVSSGIPEPTLLHRVEPEYPALAQQNGVEGDVVLLAVVTAKGMLTHLRVSSGNSLLAAAALRAVQKWRYRPARLNGKTVEVPIQITLKFELPR